MLVEKRIDELIEAGWEVLRSDFDERAFLNWKKRAVDCLTDLVGSEHMYTAYFKDFVTAADSRKVLAGSGLLFAAKAAGAGRLVPPDA